jgi:hypothetical protein
MPGVDHAKDLQGLTVVAASAHHTLARTADLLVVTLEGEIGDAESDAWRAAARATFLADGVPTFALVDTTRVIPTSTLPARMRSAAFLRESALQMKSVSLIVSSETSFVIKTVMRVAGLKHVHFVEAKHAEGALAAYREGTDVGALATTSAA